MRTRAGWVRGVCALVVASGALVAAIPRADAKDPGTVESKSLATVRAAIELLATTQQGPIPGMSKEKALPLVTSWAGIATDWLTSLEGSPYAPSPDAKGLARVFVGKAGADDLSVHLFVSDVERARLLEFVMKVGRELGYEMKVDLRNAWSCYGRAKGKRDLWIGVGVRLVSIEVSIAE